MTHAEHGSARHAGTRRHGEKAAPKGASTFGTVIADSDEPKRARGAR
jgi:hypothetical protein